MGIYKCAVAVALISLVFVCNGKEESEKGAFKSETLNSLLKDYDKMKRPEGSGPVKVTVTAFVDYLKWHKNILTATVMLRQAWNEKRLKSKEDAVRYHAKNIVPHIWTPAIYVLTALDPKVIDMGLFELKSNGDILWSQAIQFCVPCIMDAHQFYETDGAANCTIAFEDFTFTTKDVIYSWGEKNAVFSNAVDHVMSSSTTETKEKYTSGEYSRVTVNMKVQTKMNKAVVEFVDQAISEKV